MKEMYQIKLLAVSLLFSMSAVFTGCSADIEEVGSKAFDDGVSNDGFDLENDENVVALQGFFSKTFPRGEADSPFYPEMQNYEGVSPSETFQIFKDRDKLWRGECVVLNSNEELSAQYTGDVEIPVVDFSKISVIL